MSDGFIDTETRSAVNLKTEGDDRYTASCELTMIQWAVDDDEVSIWDPWTDGPEYPKDLEDLLNDPSIPLIAHNAAFDRKVLSRAARRKIDITRWRCTRAQAYSCGLPGSLDTLGFVLGLAEEDRKLADGKALIQFFCVPLPDGSYRSPYDYPAEWERFRVYGRQDTATLRRIYRLLPKINYANINLRVWHTDQLINGRGFGFDQPLARAAVSLLAKAKTTADDEILAATGGLVAAVTQRDKFLNYIVANGLGLTDLKAASIREALESSDLPAALRPLLELRLEASKSSGSKYKKGLTIVGRDSRIRGAMQFSGAGRTGRFSHKGFQPGNMSRPSMTVRKPNGKVELEPVKAKYIDQVVIPAIYNGDALRLPEVYGGPNTACALALRHCIVPAPGNELAVADFSNIEGCITAWIAGEEWKLQALREKFAGTGPDVYKLLYSRFFHKLIDTINDTERQAGKVVDLSMGFHGGVGAFATMAAGYGIDLTILPDLVLPSAPQKMRDKAYKAWRRAFLVGQDYLLEPAVYQACDVLKQMYRTASPAIDAVAYDIDRATKGAMGAPNVLFEAARCKIWYTGKELLIQLPSGRRLTYYNPQLHTTRTVDPVTGGDLRVSQSISYMTARGKTWLRIRAWMGLFVENIVQAIAADILRHSLVRVHDYCNTVPAIAAYLAALPEDERSAISLHVHDEIVADVPVGSLTLAKLIELMLHREDWMDGLPLMAEGWINPRYGKR